MVTVAAVVVEWLLLWPGEVLMVLVASRKGSRHTSRIRIEQGHLLLKIPLHLRPLLLQQHRPLHLRRLLL